MDQRIRSSTSQLLASVVESRGGAGSDELGRLFLRAGRRLLGLIRIRSSERLRRRLDPVDILQEVYIEALRLFPRFENRGRRAFYAWLREITLHKIRSLEEIHAAARRDPYREVRIRPAGSSTGGGPAPQSREPSPEARAVGWELLDSLPRALESLKAVQREVFVLVVLERRPVEEVAQSMNMRRSNVHNLIARARKDLREILEALA